MKSKGLGVVIAMIVIHVSPFGRGACPNEGWTSSTWIQNQANIAVTDVVLKEQLSAHVQEVRTRPRAMMKNNTLIWKLDTMEPMSEQIIYVEAKATEDNPIQSCATLSF